MEPLDYGVASAPSSLIGEKDLDGFCQWLILPDFNLIGLHINVVHSFGQSLITTTGSHRALGLEHRYMIASGWSDLPLLALRENRAKKIARII